MGSHREPPPLLIRPRLSRRLIGLTLLIHGTACAVGLVLPIGLARLPLLLLIALSALHAGAVHVLRRAPWSIQTALWSADGTWILALNNGRQIEVALSPATFVSLPLILLNFRSGPRRYALPLFSDALDPEQARRLRQRLRSEGARPDPAQEAA